MQGLDSSRLDPATSIQEQKYTVYRPLLVLKIGTDFADCLKCHFSISYSKEMGGLFDFSLIDPNWIEWQIHLSFYDIGLF